MCNCCECLFEKGCTDLGLQIRHSCFRAMSFIVDLIRTQRNEKYSEAPDRVYSLAREKYRICFCRPCDYSRKKTETHQSQIIEMTPRCRKIKVLAFYFQDVFEKECRVFLEKTRES